MCTICEIGLTGFRHKTLLFAFNILKKNVCSLQHEQNSLLRKCDPISSVCNMLNAGAEKIVDTALPCLHFPLRDCLFEPILFKIKNIFKMDLKSHDKKTYFEKNRFKKRTLKWDL